MTKQDMSARMSVLLPVWWPTGGIKTWLIYVLGNLDASRYRFVIVGPGKGVEDIAAALVRHQVKVVQSKESLYSFVLDCARAGWSEHISLVHSQGLTSGLGGLVASILSRRPHILTVHDVFRKEQFSGVRGWIRYATSTALLAVATRIQAVTVDAANNMLAFFPSLNWRRNAVVTIISGIDVDRFRECTPRSLKQELGLSQDTFLVGFMGRFMSQKGFQDLVDAIGLILNNRLASRMPHVVAFGWGGYIREEQDSLTARGLGEYFHFLPATSEVGSALGGLDLLVMPSRWEACGLLAMECLVVGTPLVATTCIGLREVVEGTPATKVPPRAPDRLSAAILAHCADRRREAFVAFSGVAAQRFDVRVTARKIGALYDDVIAGKLF